VSAATVYAAPAPGTLLYALEVKPGGGIVRAGIVEQRDDHLTLIGWDGDAEVSWHHTDPADRSLIVLHPRGVGVRVTYSGFSGVGTVLGWDYALGLVAVQWPEVGIIRHEPHTLTVDES
jgi:hypothetical protein